MAVLVLLFYCAPAWGMGMDFPVSEKQVMSTLYQGASLADRLEAVELGAPEILRQAEDDPMLMLDDLIIAENWLAWRMFQITPGAAVPLASAEMYIIYEGMPGKRSRLKLGQAGPRAPSVRVAVAKEEVEASRKFQGVDPGLDIPTVEQSPFSQVMLNAADKRVANLREPFSPRDQGTSVMAFVTEPLTAEPWSWDNFLPRLLIIVAILAALLFGVEFLRQILMLGLRGLSRKGGR